MAAAVEFDFYLRPCPTGLVCIFDDAPPEEYDGAWADEYAERASRGRPVAVPSDPRVRAFADHLAEAVAQLVLRDLRRDTMARPESTC